MEEMRLWSFGRGPGSISYKLFDAIRNYHNNGLSAYLYRMLNNRFDEPFRILEAGSGPGYCSSLLGAMKGVESATIFDIDRDVLNIALGRSQSIHAVQGDLYRIPFQDNSFDFVFNSSTLEHLTSFDRAFREMTRITRCGGKIFVGVPYKYGPFLPFNFIPQSNPIAVWMGRLYSEKELRKSCLKEGLVIEDMLVYFFRCFIGVLVSKNKEITHQDTTNDPKYRANRK